MVRMKGAGQDALDVVVSSGEDVLLTRALQAAVACGEYALETTLRLLSAAIPNDSSGTATGTSSEVEPSEDSPVAAPIRLPAPTEASETVHFALDGQAYELDLRPEDAGQLRAAIRPYIAAGRPVDRRTAPATGNGRLPRTGSRDRGPDTAAIREWARAHGHQVSDRGRIPTRVLRAYEASAQ